MKTNEQRGSFGEVAAVSALALTLSLLAFAFFYGRGDVLLYGDAVAHINIARRIVDSRYPGIGQLGTVWLPFPHLLLTPLVANNWLWSTGVGGSIPSMIAYVLGVAGLYRLIRARASALSASFAAAPYALNPSLLYMQATAMTESIFLCSVIWSVVYLDEFARGIASKYEGDAPALPAWRALERCGLCLGAAVLTRYDGWILAFGEAICCGVLLLRWWLRNPAAPKYRITRSAVSFVLFLALCPALWLAYNYKVTHNPFDWINGPYSAKAIEKRTTDPGAPGYPGKNSMGVAALHFLKAARMDTGEGAFEKCLFLLALGGTAIAVRERRRFGILLFLWIPLPFYAYSVAYGSVPIFVPEWWPFSYYNVRYGLELLPTFVAFIAVLVWAAQKLTPRARFACTIAVAVLCAGAYFSSANCSSSRSRDRYWGRTWMIPLCYREAYANSRGRLALEKQVADLLSKTPPDATILMYTSDYVGALQRADIPIKRVISESSWEDWDAALSAPWLKADYVVAVDGDPVAKAVKVNPRGLTTIAIFHVKDKPKVTVYRGRGGAR